MSVIFIVLGSIACLFGGMLVLGSMAPSLPCGDEPACTEGQSRLTLLLLGVGMGTAGVVVVTVAVLVIVLMPDTGRGSA